MKQTQEITVRPAIFEAPFRTALEGRILSQLCRLKTIMAELFEQPRQLLFSTMAVLFVTVLFLAGSYLFFSQLAEFGW